MLQSFLLVLSLCLDSFVASIAYGTDKINIPIKSSILINFVCSLFLSISLLGGNIFKDFISAKLASNFSFVILFSLGFYRFFEAIFKNYFRKYSNKNKPIMFKLFDFRFMLNVYVDEIKADFDNSKTLTLKEAFYLSSALSLDSLAVGFGISLINDNYIQIVLLTFVMGIISISSGVYLGKKFSNFSNINFSYLSGMILMIIAFGKI